MKTDAISRSALLEMIERTKCAAMSGEVDFNKSQQRAIVAISELFLNVVKDIPDLDVAPVANAEWIEDGYRGIPCVCSYCGEEAYYISTFREQFDYDWEENLVPCGYEEIREHIRSNYCPNCGARMDAEESA